MPPVCVLYAAHGSHCPVVLLCRYQHWRSAWSACICTCKHSRRNSLELSVTVFAIAAGELAFAGLEK